MGMACRSPRYKPRCSSSRGVVGRSCGGRTTPHGDQETSGRHQRARRSASYLAGCGAHGRTTGPALPSAAGRLQRTIRSGGASELQDRQLAVTVHVLRGELRSQRDGACRGGARATWASSAPCRRRPRGAPWRPPWTSSPRLPTRLSPPAVRPMGGGGGGTPRPCAVPAATADRAGTSTTCRRAWPGANTVDP